MTKSPEVHDDRPAFIAGLLAGLLIAVAGTLLAFAGVNGGWMNTAGSMVVFAPLAGGLALLFIRRWRRFGAGLITATVGVATALLLLAIWLVATIGS